MSFLRKIDQSPGDPLSFGGGKDMAELLFNIGMLGIARGYIPEATNVFEAIRFIRPKSEAPFIGLGLAAIVQEQYDMAVAALLNGALELNPKNKTAKALLGFALQRSGHSDKADVIYKEILTDIRDKDPAIEMVKNFMRIKKAQ